MAADGHDTVESVVTPDGGFESDHVAPPFWVTMMEATLPPSSPTATQVVEPGVALGAQETPLTLASGAELAVVSQLGMTAAAGGVQTSLPKTLNKAKSSTVDRAVTVILLTACTASTATSLPHGEPDK